LTKVFQPCFIASAAELLKSGGKITQEAIASLADASQGWVSKFFAGLGGWRVWRQIITSLLKASYRTSNNFEEALENLSDDERWIAQDCLRELVAAFEDDPKGVAEAVAATAIGYGAEAWARILAAADRVVVARLLGLMAIVCPGWVRKGVQKALSEDGNPQFSSVNAIMNAMGYRLAPQKLQTSAHAPQ
jgi:DNA-binding phage protein